MRRPNQRGEGWLGALVWLAVLAGAGAAGYVYLWPLVSGSDKPAASAEATPTAAPPAQGKAGSMAGAAVQGAEAAGEVYGSGR